MLTRLMILKYGELPDWAIEKLQQADKAQLLQWSEQLFNAETLEQLFSS